MRKKLLEVSFLFEFVEKIVRRLPFGFASSAQTADFPFSFIDMRFDYLKQ